jgi:hypothetical protein
MCAKKPPHWINETTVKQNDRLVLSKNLLRHPAFIKLTGSAKQILLELYMRLTLESYKPKRNTQKFYAKNNGKLIITYKQMHKMFGYSTATISSAIDRLVRNGFIEIAEIGVGVKRQSHKIALIKNWQYYGTEKFKPGKGKTNKPVNGGFKSKKTETTSESKEGITSGTKAVKSKNKKKPA